MPNVGIGEIAIVLVIALLIFGPKRLPELGRSLGRGLNEFRDGLQNINNDFDEDEDDDLDEEETDQEGTALPQPALDSGEVVNGVLPGVEPDITEVTAAPGQESQSSDRTAKPSDGEAAPGQDT